MLKVGGYVQVRYLGRDSDDVAYSGVVVDATRSRATIELVNTSQPVLADHCEIRAKAGADVHCYSCRVLVAHEGGTGRGLKLSVEVLRESLDVYVREVFRHTVPDGVLTATFGADPRCRVVAISPHGIGLLCGAAHEVGSQELVELRRDADAWRGVAEVRYVRPPTAHGIHHGLLVPPGETALRRGLGELSAWIERLNLQAAARVRDRLFEPG
ncbi:MAG: hypothetical protein U0610_20725 [bacterium]